jgi:UDP-N-acetylglucosamine 1-carboxyvinyltransferase
LTKYRSFYVTFIYCAAYSVNKFFIAGCVMSRYIIRGGKPLIGTVEAQGSKNSAVAILLACIAVRGRVVLRRVPYITDVLDCIEILRCLGGVVEWLPDRSLCVDCTEIEYKLIPADITGRIRASTYIMGAFINRFGRCPQLKSGGCSLGERPVDLHVDSLIALGATVSSDGGLNTGGALNGTYEFPKITVGGTVNSVIASACGCGRCVLKNCAKEPHVLDLIGFLNACGADIHSAESGVVTVCGVKALHGCEFTLSGDMIEAGTYLIAGAATGGTVTVNGICPDELESLCAVLNRMGIGVTFGEASVGVSGRIERGITVETGAYPLFPTDLHPQIVALMGSGPYGSSLRECVFGSDRFRYLSELGKQGLDYRVEGNLVTVRGRGYKASRVSATDLRGGAANVIAALCADGESIVGRAEFVERGYSDIVLKLRALGADVWNSVE